MHRLPRVLPGLVIAAAVVVVTWPQAVQLRGVTDLGDPLLNAWTLAWVAHAIASPARIFDANIFHPESGTLAYSEMLLVPAGLVAPLQWIGLDPLVVYNLLQLAAYVCSGLAMFALVRRIASHDGAALVSGVAFAVYPYRIEAAAHLQLQIVWWTPLALLAVHRILARPGWRESVLLGLTAAAQVYSCIYLGVYGAIAIGAIAFVLLLAAPRGTRLRAARFVAAGGLLAAMLVAPLALPYASAARVVGTRSEADLRLGSAEMRDYRRAAPENAMYGDDRHPGPAERRLFPGYAAPALAAIGLIPPIGPLAAAYAAGGLVAFDVSLGVNAPGYAWLHRHVRPFQALRVPARSAMFVGLALSVLIGLGIARICRARSASVQAMVVAAAAICLVLEGRMRPQSLMQLPDPRPAVYEWLAGQTPGVVCEYPVGNLQGRAGPQDATYMYYSTRHWMPLVNGYSGFAPPSYHDLIEHLRDFPDPRAIEYLRNRRVDYLLVHSVFYIRGDYPADVARLRMDDQLEWVGRFPWKGGGVSDAFRVRGAR